MKYLIVICLFFQVITTTAYGQAYKYHTVSPGETVYSISQKYGVSEAAIYKYNPDAKNGIQISSKLVIPIGEDNNEAPTSNSSEDAPVSFTSHKVEKKETLYSLSKMYNIEIEDIKKYNKQLYSKELQKGETIQIPVYGQKSPSAIVKNEVPSKPRTETTERRTPAVQITKTREHIILPKETKYGIARKYGMTVAELEALNPTVDVLHPGIMLKVGTNVLDEPVIITDNAFEFYEVQPQETLYSLTKRFQIEQDSLIALNPALKDGLKYGMVLKVPTRDASGRELKDLPVDKLQMPIGNAEIANLQGRIKDYSTKNIVLMLPYNLSKIKIDSTSNASSVLENDRVMRISLDFYSGALMAINKAKQLGISTNVKVFDTQQQESKVISIINSNNFNDVDAVIGPLLQKTSEETAERLSGKNIPVISPMTNRDLRSLPNLYQTMPSDDMLREAMISYIQRNAQGRNIIIVADAANASIKSKLMSALPNAKMVNPSGNNVSESSLANVMSSTAENWVVLESESVALLSSATSALNRLARRSNITLLTTNKNSSYESDVLLNEHLGKLKFHYPSEYKEFDESQSNEFIDAYKEKYGFMPNKYTTRGYDLTLDVLLRLSAMGTLEKSVQENIITEYVENEFHYKPKQNGGFYNTAVYIMTLDENLNLSVAK